MSSSNQFWPLEPAGLVGGPIFTPEDQIKNAEIEPFLGMENPERKIESGEFCDQKDEASNSEPQSNESHANQSKSMTIKENLGADLDVIVVKKHKSSDESESFQQCLAELLTESGIITDEFDEGDDLQKYLLQSKIGLIELFGPEQDISKHEIKNIKTQFKNLQDSPPKLFVFFGIDLFNLCIDTDRNDVVAGVQDAKFCATASTFIVPEISDMNSDQLSYFHQIKIILNDKNRRPTNLVPPESQSKHGPTNKEMTTCDHPKHEEDENREINRLLDASLQENGEISETGREPRDTSGQSDLKPQRSHSQLSPEVEGHIAEAVLIVLQKCRDGTLVIPDSFVRPSTPKQSHVQQQQKQQQLQQQKQQQQLEQQQQKQQQQQIIQQQQYFQQQPPSKKSKATKNKQVPIQQQEQPPQTPQPREVPKNLLLSQLYQPQQQQRQQTSTSQALGSLESFLQQQQAQFPGYFNQNQQQQQPVQQQQQSRIFPGSTTIQPPAQQQQQNYGQMRQQQPQQQQNFLNNISLDNLLQTSGNWPQDISTYLSVYLQQPNQGQQNTNRPQPQQQQQEQQSSVFYQQQNGSQ